MDQMEDVLIDSDVNDFDVISSDIQPSTSHAARSSSKKAAAALGHFASAAEVHRGSDRQTASDAGLAVGTVNTTIMMYSPDIPSAEGRNAYDTKPNLANYYTMIETEETVKCVISTTLFCAVVLAIVLVAFLINPNM